MRYNTIKRRLRLSCLSEEEIHNVYIEMKGISDKNTMNGKGQKKWVNTLSKAFGLKRS